MVNPPADAHGRAEDRFENVSNPSNDQPPASRQHRYSVVTGQGRSGTNWLLDLLDTSSETYCRNEPNAIPGSPFEVLGPLWLNDINAPVWDTEWDRVVDIATRSMGERDHPFSVRKDFARPLAQSTTAIDRLHGRRSLQALRVVMPSLREGQWPVPRWVASPDQLAAAHAILKVNRANGVLRWVLVNRPHVPVVNIIRHPCGRHLSYQRRFLANHDGTEVLEASRDWLREIARHDAAWGARFGDIERHDHLEAQMWMWRYVNETLDETGQQAGNYHRVVYEELADDPIGHVEHLYGALGLRWDDEARAAAQSSVNHSVWGQSGRSEVGSRRLEAGAPARGHRAHRRHAGRESPRSALELTERRATTRSGRQRGVTVIGHDSSPRKTILRRYGRSPAASIEEKRRISPERASWPSTLARLAPKQ